MLDRSSRAWRRTAPIPFTDQHLPSVSVLIAARNESERIQPTLEALQTLHYPGEWEVILIDDHSEDHTRAMIQNFNYSQFKLVSSNGHGKRAALKTGAEMAKGDILLFTDADCVPPPDWVLAMAAPFQDDDLHWISGPVISNPGPSVVSRYDTLESQGLMAWTGAGFTLANPVLAQGANMAVRKVTFDRIAATALPDHASGDDLFFLAECKAMYPQGCRFQSAKQAIIQTAAPDSWRSLIDQRLRWASKTGQLQFGHGQAPMIITFLMSLTFISSTGILLFCPPETWPLIVIPLLLNILADYRLLSSGWSSGGPTPSWSTYWAAVFIHPVLVLISGVLGPLRRTYLWKGRMVR